MKQDRWEILPDEHADEDEDVSNEDFMADMMQGFEELAAARRGEKSLPTTIASHIEGGKGATFYNMQTDELYLSLSNEPIAASETSPTGLQIDYDANGKVRGITIKQASSQLASVPRREIIKRSAA